MHSFITYTRFKLRMYIFTYNIVPMPSKLGVSKHKVTQQNQWVVDFSNFSISRERTESKLQGQRPNTRCRGHDVRTCCCVLSICNFNSRRQDGIDSI